MKFIVEINVDEYVDKDKCWYATARCLNQPGNAIDFEGVGKTLDHAAKSATGRLLRYMFKGE